MTRARTRTSAMRSLRLLRFGLGPGHHGHHLTDIYRCKTMTISWVGMAPSRKSPSGRAEGQVDDGCGQGVAGGTAVIMSGMRSPIWSRTAAAWVHSAAPCRFAEVAVMGQSEALDDCSRNGGIGHAEGNVAGVGGGTQGSLVPARTMMVKGRARSGLRVCRAMDPCRGPAHTPAKGRR